MAIIGKTMHDQAKQQAMLLHDAIEDRREKLSKPPEDLEALKSIVRLIGEIRESTPSMEDKFTVVEEQFRTLMLFEYPTEDAARELAMGIRQKVCVHPCVHVHIHACVYMPIMDARMFFLYSSEFHFTLLA
jgi:hypothetical protein